ncbi:hypothetical protein Vretimale_9047 [Volvox reticuliferus]|uniref:4a-hydroxytetrahydrobiopterin dehydratase n=1 Tax=Volvox reticuliferus TaxID=1737510 RepID=A0A8J4FVL6_9CHLO|nr:hypothetical protein Vretifemale_14269 [Volvox reticuliferus]GIM04487.1 hypothetical protein Vretimale_9047 [Volvox reticuliferus]
MLRQAILRYRHCDRVLFTCTPEAARRCRSVLAARVSAKSLMTLNIQGPGADKLRAEGCSGACSRDTPRVEPAELVEFMKAIPAWHLSADKTVITRTFTAKNFMAAIRFFNKLAEVAEAEGHHPDIHLRNFREVEINLSTHVVGGLTRPDFAMAAKLDMLEVEYSPKWAKEEAERLAAAAGGVGGDGEAMSVEMEASAP